MVLVSREFHKTANIENMFGTKQSEVSTSVYSSKWTLR